MPDPKPRPKTARPDSLSDPMAPTGPRDGSTASYRPTPGVSGVYTFLDPPEVPGEVGRLGKYRVLGVIGQGGMGVVFRAEETGLGRVVALKVMLPQFAGNALAKARFVREGRAAAKVEHDHILPIYAVDELRGVPYIAMPLLKGMALGDALKAAPRPPLSEVLRIGREIAEGLSAAHDQGLVHRDIKPANVWLEGNRRRVKILDFGLARAGEDVTNPDDPKTQSGAVVGTPMYMSPEQGNADPVDARTDLWSLGVVLYEMTTGRRPFTGKTTMAVLSALANHHPPPPNAVVPECPPELAALVTALLAKHPGQRPGSAAWVAEELGRIEQGLSVMMAEPVPLAEAADDPWAVLSAATEPAVATPAAAEKKSAAPSRPAPRAGRKAPLAWAAGGVAVLVLAVAAAVLMRPKAEPRAEATEPAPPTTARKIPPATRPKPTTPATDPGPPPADPPKPADPPAPPAGVNSAGLPPPADPHELEFDGSGHVFIPTLTRAEGAPVTVEAFVTLVQNKGGVLIRMEGPAGFQLYGWPKAGSPDEWTPNVTDGGGKYNTPDTPALTLGRRTHLAAQMSDTEVTLFINGRKAFTTPHRAAPPAPFSGTVLGAQSGGEDRFGSQTVVRMDEVRISKGARYAADFTPAARFDPDKDTLALYHCDAGAGDELKDVSGNNHHGKLGGGVKWVPAPGHLGPPPPADPAFFNGKDLTGWQTDPPGVWGVKDGALRVDSPELQFRAYTAARYADFDLAFRLKAMPTTRVWFRGTPGGDGLFNGPHLHVRDNAFAFNTIGKSVEGPKPTQDWHDIRVRCVGKRVQVVVNGLTLADDEFDVPANGAIGFYVPGGRRELAVTDIRFRDLSKPAAEGAFFNGKDLAGWVTDNKQHWTVEDGTIIARFPPKAKVLSKLVSVATFEDFELAFRARVIATPGTDSHLDLWFRANIRFSDDGTQIRGVGGTTCRLAGPQGWGTVGDHKVPLSDAALRAVKPDDFNTVVLRCVGKKATATINGVPVGEGVAGNPRGGFSWTPWGGVREVTIRDIQFTDLSKK